MEKNEQNWSRGLENVDLKQEVPTESNGCFREVGQEHSGVLGGGPA